MSLLVFLHVGSLINFAVLLIAAAWQDLRTLRIANGLPMAIVISFVPWAFAGLELGSLSLAAIYASVLCAVVVFALGVLGFALGLLGGGDVKLLTAASLFAGPALQLDFLTVTALVGGLLGVALLAGAPIGPVLARSAPHARLRGSLPYGPAIAAGGLWVAASLALA